MPTPFGLSQLTAPVRAAEVEWMVVAGPREDQLLFVEVDDPHDRGDEIVPLDALGDDVVHLDQHLLGAQGALPQELEERLELHGVESGGDSLPRHVSRE